MTRRRFFDSTGADCLLHRQLQGTLFHMMPALGRTEFPSWIVRKAARREDPLPFPGLFRVGIFAIEGMRQVNPAIPLSMSSSNCAFTFRKWRCNPAARFTGSIRYPVLGAFAVAHGDSGIAKIDILYPVR